MRGVRNDQASLRPGDSRKPHSRLCRGRPDSLHRIGDQILDRPDLLVLFGIVDTAQVTVAIGVLALVYAGVAGLAAMNVNR